MAEHTETVTIESMTRVRNSTNGGPRYRVQLTDGRTFQTRPDCADSYGWTEGALTNRPVILTTDVGGRVYGIDPAIDANGPI